MQTKTRILQLHADDTAALTSIDDNGHVLKRQVVHNLSDVADKNNRLIVLIPGYYILMSKVKLPKTNRRELIRAIPFALEDQLASDIDELFFVLGEKTGDQWAVATINKAVLENYQKRLTACQLSPIAIIPDFLALPYAADEWTIFTDGKTAQVRTGKQSGFSVEINRLSSLLQLTLDHEPALIPKQITLYREKGSSIQNFSAIQAKIPINIRQPNEITYSALVSELPFNLLSTKYRPRSTNKLKRYWHFAMYSVVTWIFVLFLSTFAEWFYWHERYDHLQQRITSIYQSTFPNSTDDSDPQSRMRNEIDALRKSNRGNRFIQLLEQSAAVLHSYPQINVTSIGYQNDQLVFELTTDSLSKLEALTRAMNKVGLHVEQNQMNGGGKNISAEVVVK